MTARTYVIGRAGYDVLGEDVEENRLPVPRLYKVVSPDGGPLNGGSGNWPLPTVENLLPAGSVTRPGAWREVEGPIVPCQSGLHLCTAEQLPNWLPDRSLRAAGYAEAQPFVVYAVETDGPVIDAGDKYVAGRVRLLPGPRTMPDMAQAAKRKANAVQRAERARVRAMQGVTAYGYLASLSPSSLPIGHPLRSAVEAYNAADRAFRAAADKAEATYSRTLARALSTVTA